MYCFHPKMHAIPNKVKEKQSKEKENTPPLTPQGENGGEGNGGLLLSASRICLQQEDTQSGRFDVELQQLHIVDRNEINAILRLSDYGRLGGYVFKIISSTRWSTVLAKGKYVIAALRKEKTRNG